MEEQIIEFETAKLASKNGYPKNRNYCELAYKKDDKSLCGDVGLYTDYPAPTQSLLQKWLREEHGIYIEVSIHGIYDELWFEPTVLESKELFPMDFNEQVDTYEEALEIGLYQALNLIK